MNATIAYEIFVPSYCDSNGDGIGDLDGIASKLPYLYDLGVDLIWLSPIFSSPSYHKYDVADYHAIDHRFGDMAGFERLINKANTLGIKVILDLVLNHTSTQHPWFKNASSGQNSTFRDFYIWKTPAEIKTLNAEQRAETADSQERNPWHLVQKNDTQKYYGMFWSGMPDLNLANEAVQEEVFKIAQFWLVKGVAGFRLDAAKHVFPPWEEEKTQPFWADFKAACQKLNSDVYIVGEVWTSAENVSPYYKSFTSNFNFELCDGIRDILRNGRDQHNLIERLIKAYQQFGSINPHFIDASMLGNHDMERIATVANDVRDKLKMAAFLQFTLPGLPYMYYGDELGMYGHKPDERIREAFLWDTRWQDTGRCQWQKPKYNTDSKVSPLKLQMEDEDSIWHFYKKIIAFKKSNAVLRDISNFTLEKTNYSSEELLSYFRIGKDHRLLVFQNISKNTKTIETVENIQEVLWLEKGHVNGQYIELEAFGSVIISD